MRRRPLLIATALAAGLGPLVRADEAAPAGRSRPLEAIRGEWREFAPAGAELSVSLEPLTKDRQSWRDELGRDAFHVLFEEGTEAPFSSALDAEKRAGLYVCAACELPLFTSEMKFDSGTGWPSFFTHIPGHFGTKKDFKLIWPRTEYHCIRCGGHHGHVFGDGPPPTGERWCNNGIALRFLPR